MMFSTTILIFILNCLSFSVTANYDVYPNGQVNRNITNISQSHVLWLRENCGVKKEPPEGEEEIEFKIYGGEVIDDFQYPWTVRLDIMKHVYYGPNNVNTGSPTEASCSGTLISNKHLLTAQHCFMNKWKERQEDMDESKLKILYGTETDFKAKIIVGIVGYGSYWHFSNESARHFSNIYNGTMYTRQYDWALVELRDEVPQELMDMGALVPICLPTRDQTLDPSDQVEIYGQGGIQANRKQPGIGHGLMRYISTSIKSTKIYASPGDRLDLRIISITDDVSRKGDSGGGITKAVPVSHHLISGDVLLTEQCKHVLVGITKGHFRDKTTAVDVRYITDEVQNSTGIVV